MVDRATVENSIRKFNGVVQDLVKSERSNFEANLWTFVDFCHKDPIISKWTREFETNEDIDVEKWYEDFLSTGGSMVGSQKYWLPPDEHDRASLQFMVLVAIHSGVIDFDNFCLGAYGTKGFPLMIDYFSDAFVSPLARYINERLGDLLTSLGEVAVPSTASFVFDTLDSLGWKEPSRLLRNAEKAFNDGRMPDCCYNLRKALIVTWMKTCSKITGKDISFKKAEDAGELQRILTDHIPEEDASVIRRVVSHVTDKTHIEKKRGESPSETEVNFCRNLTFAAIEYLLKLAMG